MASSALQCKLIKPTSESAARGSLDAFLGKTYPLKESDKAAEAEAEAAPAHMETERMPLQKSDAEAHGKQLELESESITLERDASECPTLDHQIYSLGNLSGETNHLRSNGDEEIMDVPQNFSTNGLEKEGQDTLSTTALVKDFNRNPECILAAKVITEVTNSGINCSVVSDEPIPTIAASDESFPNKFHQESVSLPTAVESFDGAVFATNSASETSNLEESHQKTSCAEDTKAPIAVINDMLPMSCEISLKASPASKKKLKLNSDSKNRAAKKSKINGAQSGDDDALKDSGSIVLVEQTTSEVFTPHASNDFFLPTSKKRVKLRQSQVEIKETTNIHDILTPMSKKKRKVVEIEPLSTKVMSTSIESSKSLHGREKKSIRYCSVELEATNADKSFPYKVDVDLWKEAKLAAEENARLSVGKPTHPFFSRQRSTMTNYASPSQLNVEEVCVDCLLSSDLGELPPSLPYHVTQVYESMETTIDWKNLKLLDAANIFQSKVLSIARKSSDSIRHSTLNGSRNGWFLNNLGGNALSTILCMNVEEFSFRDLHSEDHSKIQEKRSTDSWLQELFEYLKKRSKSSSSESVDQEEAQSSDICEGADELTFMKLKEMLSWYCSVCPSSMGQDNGPSGSHNNLWTDKYQPRSSKQVCGNKDSLSFLNNWLHSWKVRIACERKTENTEKLCSTSNRSKLVNENDHRGWSQDDSDDDVTNSEEEELCNAVLLTGPVGSGKSAAVYACAKEQGFTVLEINASEVRNGILIKHKFGEAMESHGLTKWSADDNINPTFSPVKGRSENTHVSRCYKGEKEAEMNLSVEMDCNEIHPEKHDQCLTGKDTRIFQDPGMQKNLTENNALDISENQRGRMTLILFEDVDVIFEEDRGFLAALVQLAKTTKRPLILTSNKGQPRLPQLDKLEVQFSKPSIDDLVTHIFMVCISENMPSSPGLIEQLVKFCNHDLRRLMMMLQFWGQRSGSSVQSEIAYSVSQNKTDISVQLMTEEPSQNMTCCGCNFGNPCDFLSSINKIGECCISCLKEQDISSTRPKDETEMSQENIAVSSASGSLKEVIVDEVPLAEQSGIWALRTRLLFASNAQHCVLPHLLSLSYPCPLSQLINDKVIKAAQEEDGVAECVAAQLAEVKVAMDHTENRKMQKLKKKLKATTSSPTKDEEIIIAVSNTLLEYGADDGALAESVERGTINSSPLHCARKQLASKMLGRRKGHHSIVFSDSEDEGLGARKRPPEAAKRFNCDLPNARTVDDMSVYDIYGSFSNALGESISFEKHQDTMSLQNHTQINSKDVCLPDNKPDKFRRLKRLNPGSKTTASFDVKEKCDGLSTEAGTPWSKLEKNCVSSVIREVPVVLEVNSESQLSEKHDTFTDMASDCPPTCYSTEGTFLSKECLLKNGRKFKEDVHKHDSDVGSTNDEVTFPLNNIVEPLASSQSPVAGNSCMTPSSIDATLNFLNLNPVSKLWSMLSESKEGTAMTCAQTSSEALEVSRLLASFEDILSASDVISTVMEPQLMDSEFAEEVAANLAQFGLGLCLQQCQNAACAPDLFNIDEKPILRSELQLNVGPFCLEHELTRHETKFQLQEMLDSILSVKAMAATKSSFIDFSTFITRISQLEQLRQLNNPSRSRRTRKQHYLDSHTFPVFKGRAPALKLSDFGVEDG